MAVVVKLNEKKEPINELLGTLLAWGLIAGLLAKLFGFKFNISDTDEMRQWGFQLGDAIKFSRQRIKKSNLTPDQQAQADQVINTADKSIRTTIQRNNEIISKDPAAAKTLNTNQQVMSILNNAVSEIEQIFGGDRQRAEEVVQPLRDKVSSLGVTLNNLTQKAAIGKLLQNPRLNSSLNTALKGNAQAVQAVLSKIAQKVKS